MIDKEDVIESEKSKNKKNPDEDILKFIGDPYSLNPTCNNYQENRKNFKNFLLNDIPDKLRLKYWLSFSGALREKNLHANYYESLSTEYPKYIPCESENVIEADVERTFPENEYFKEKKNKQKLRNVLLAYARRNGKIGYCQGFNFIVGKLLMMFNNECDVFWLFVQIIENILPCEYYSELVGVMGDCSICLELLKRTNKKIMRQLAGFEIIVNNLLYRWFISLFVENVSQETFLCIWDAMFLEGNIVLFRAASAILELLETDIKGLEGMENLTMFFEEQIAKQNFKRSKLMKRLIFEEKINLSMCEIDSLRTQYYAEVEGKIISTKMNEAKIEVADVECDKEWPFCIESRGKNKKNKNKNKNNNKSNNNVKIVMNKQKLNFNDEHNNNNNNNNNKENNKEIKEDEENDEDIIFDPLLDIQHVQVFRRSKINIIQNYLKNIGSKRITADQSNKSNIKSNICNNNKSTTDNNNNSNSINIKSITDSNKNECNPSLSSFRSLVIYRARHFCEINKNISDKPKEDILMRKSVLLKSSVCETGTQHSGGPGSKPSPQDIIDSIGKSFIPSFEFEGKKEEDPNDGNKDNNNELEKEDNNDNIDNDGNNENNENIDNI